MKISALSVNTEGISLGPTVKIGTQGTPDKEVSVPSLTIQKRVSSHIIHTILTFWTTSTFVFFY